MTKYFGEVESEINECLCHVYEIEVENPRSAYDKLAEMIESGVTGEFVMIYQITTPRIGAKLPQPVYDFMNGFSIYE